MRLLRFTDWDMDKGAKIEAFNVEPAPSDMNEATKAFEKGLEYLRSYNDNPLDY